MKKSIRRFLGQNPWKKEWQDGLSNTLEETQQGVNANMVVAIAVESDFYAEVLFILSFVGLALGTIAGFLCRGVIDNPNDLILFPATGFAIGASCFQFRHFYLHRFAPKALRERVAARAKAMFFDHSHNMKGRVVLLYFSELEREVLLVSDPEMLKEIPSEDLRKHLSKLIRDYSANNPLISLRPCLIELGNLLRIYLGPSKEGEMLTEIRVPIYLGATDKTDYLKVPILKGSKDIN